MKKLLFSLMMIASSFTTIQAMSFEQARQEALFLTDKMAYELNLTDEQYEAAYEINLDYLMGISTQADVFGDYWTRRNLDFSYVLIDWQYRIFCDALYFYRPIYWDGGFWHFRIYGRYPHRTHFYFGRPHFWHTYHGGHSWHHNGGRSYYHGRRYEHHKDGGMHDRYIKGSFNHGDPRGNNNTGNHNGGNGSHNNSTGSHNNSTGNHVGNGDNNNQKGHRGNDYRNNSGYGSSGINRSESSSNRRNYNSNVTPRRMEKTNNSISREATRSYSSPNTMSRSNVTSRSMNTGSSSHSMSSSNFSGGSRGSSFGGGMRSGGGSHGGGSHGGGSYGGGRR